MNGSLFIRIDDRLIHGQIVTAWAKVLNIKKIIALDDALAVSEMLAEILLMGISDAYEPEILTTSAVESFLSHHPRDENVLLITRAAENLDLLKEQLSFASAANIGNCSKKEASAYIFKGIGLCQNLRASFFHYLKEMERLGYGNKYEILNAMDFGIPQKRECIFVVSIFGNNPFNFAKLEKMQVRDISEFLEKNASNLYEVRQEPMLRHIRGEPKNKNFRGRFKVIDKFSYTISTSQVRIPNLGNIDLSNGKYRYFTERECFRLMGFDDEDFNKLKAIYPGRKGELSSILYKQAGNSIVVNVLEVILKNMYHIK